MGFLGIGGRDRLPRLDLAEEMSHFKRRTPTSEARFAEFRRHIAGGVTANVKFMDPYPIVMRSARGSHLVDVDDNDYIDYALGYGPLILGHGHPAVVNAIKSQLESCGTSIFGAPNEMELEMAKRVSSLYKAAECVRFSLSGTDATLNALRVAKAYTGKEKVAKFEGHYHGWHEYALVSVSPELRSAGPESEPSPVPFGKGVPKRVLDSTVVLPFNDPPAVERIVERERGDLAAVIMEPVPRGYIVPEKEFLKCVRDVTRENDIPLIFDEVMTGFRFGLGGAASYFGVEPDLVTFGKIIGGGLPGAVFAGRSDIMNMLSPHSQDARAPVFHSGTYNACPTVLAAGMATLDVLQQPGTYEQLDRAGETLRRSLKEVIDESNVQASVLGLSSIFHVIFTTEKVVSYRQAAAADSLKRKSLDLAMYNRGVFFPHSHCCFLSLAHGKDDTEKTVDALESALA